MIEAIIVRDEQTHEKVGLAYDGTLDALVVEIDGVTGVMKLHVKDIFSSVELLKASYIFEREQRPRDVPGQDKPFGDDFSDLDAQVTDGP